MFELTRESPAKINLTLRVGGLRPDGYHEIESLIARVTLCDEVSVAPRRDGRLTLTCSQAGIPGDQRNLALQAARRLADAAGVRKGAHISIDKRIPAGAGLGGGSSNAATVLLLLNELWELGLTTEELAQVGAGIGSDVPLFFHRPVCIVRGRGERVEDVEQPLSGWVALFLPELRCATPTVYQAWDRMEHHPGRPVLPEVLTAFPSPTELAALLFNDLEEPACAAYPQLGKLAEYLRRRCGEHVRMTGSGAGFFCLTRSEDRAQAIAAEATLGSPLPVRAVVVAIGA